MEAKPLSGCAACGSVSHYREPTARDGIEMTLCIDPIPCVRRYRRGVSAAAYAATLRTIGGAA